MTTTTPTRRNASEDRPDLTVKVDTKPYPLRINEVSGSVVARLRRESGLAWVEVLGSLTGKMQADLDTMAAVMCVSEWQRGLSARTYDEVAAGLNYESVFAVEYGDEAEDVREGEDPNA
jgi:hypothetical protein